MEALWNLLEVVDHKAIQLLEKLDKLQKKEPYLARTQKLTETVRAPQRVIEFES